ncbi:NAD(P)-dependent oxidoreductase [Rhizobium sp. ICMP 5592]|uniref:NAD(P)-dependent oxidoreductase n=1 Tax=Rhizobium sp. ICMP 5592 TaxID=2292445 RepID=UPI00336AD41D
MNVDTRNAVPGNASIRRPVVLNQLGAEFDNVLGAHWSQPVVVPGYGEDRAWDIPKGVDVLLTRPGPGWKAAPRVRPPEWPNDLRWIQVASAGIDFYPDWFVAADGPKVSCGRGITANPIAEYVFAAILEHEKRLRQLAIHTPEQYTQLATGTLEGKTIGLFGFGAIGKAVAARANAFGTEVLAVRRTSSFGTQDGVRFLSGLEELVADSDHLVLAAPFTPQTRHILDARILSVAKPGQHIINVARGGLIDQEALLAALDGSTIAGATLDVTDPEPLPADHPLYRHPKVLITPHISWSGTRNAQRLTDRIIANLDAYVRGQPLSDVVDPLTRY